MEIDCSDSARESTIDATVFVDQTYVGVGYTEEFYLDVIAQDQ